MPAGLPPANLWKHRFFSPRSHEATKFPAQHLPVAISSSQLRAFVVKKKRSHDQFDDPGEAGKPRPFRCGIFTRLPWTKPPVTNCVYDASLCPLCLCGALAFPGGDANRPIAHGTTLPVSIKRYVVAAHSVFTRLPRHTDGIH
jgi:hypothetical protein